MTQFRFSEQQTKSLRHLVADEIRRAIFTGQLKPGDRLREQDIAEQMNISRGPVREALSLLDREGLVIVYPYRETVVAQLSHEEIVEVVIPVRYTLESFAVKKVLPDLSEVDFQYLESLVEGMKWGALQKNLLDIVEKDVAFHRFFIEKSNQHSLLSLWDSIDMRIRLHFATHGREYKDLLEIHAEHVELLEALKTKDLETVIEAFRRHICEQNVQ
jgi:DNA-binding GntR family transcriptional regulator